ncbi:MAG: sugar ABC transporter permease [Bifidobacteriaceae bacterium]|jgi:ABC-type sugar transport system permease subunit|nr:sugar ABC transporter permease [Bifidobacteriaceae bacterium]
MRWLSPALILSVGLIYYCIFYSGYLSTFSWRGGRTPMKPVGLDNYVKALESPVFWQAIIHTLVFFVVVYTVQVLGGVAFSAAMHSGIKFATLYKVIIFTPVVIAPAIMAPAHIQVWSSGGTVNAILDRLGLASLAQSWIGQSSTSLMVVTAVQCWGAVGFGFLLYHAAMGQIDNDILEAARLDGAGNIRTLFSVILPNVRGTTVSLGILNFITALKLFDNPWLLTQGGPAHSSEFLGTMIYSEVAGQSRNIGYASALSMILLVIAIVISVVMSVWGRERPPRAPSRRQAKRAERKVLTSKATERHRPPALAANKGGDA